MKYGILFSIASVLFFVAAIQHGGWSWLLIWPGISFGVVGLGYLFWGPRIYSKSNSGILSPLRQLLLLPYLLLLWSMWHLLRFVKSESAYDQITENLFLGRRLLSHEVPDHFEHVIDLTCEFTEPQALRSLSYYSFPVLDGFIPTAEDLQAWITQTASLSGNIYIHCAEGHGRSGLFTAALLLHLGQANTAEEALKFIQSKRKLVRLGHKQMAVLRAYEKELQRGGIDEGE